MASLWVHGFIPLQVECMPRTRRFSKWNLPRPKNKKRIKVRKRRAFEHVLTPK
jgi:hypothetical protein